MPASVANRPPIPSAGGDRTADSVATTTSAFAHFPALDGMRAIGAFLVVLTHVGFQTGRSLDGSLFATMLARGNFGVTIFFVLSGFLLYRPFAAAALDEAAFPRIRRYARRRAVRILPALWVFLAIVLAFVVEVKATAREWTSFFFLVQVYNGTDTKAELRHLWSLSAEVFFYALLPLIALVIARPRGGPDRSVRRQVIAIAALIAASYAFILLRGNGVIPVEADTGLPNYLSWFCWGMLLAVASVCDERVGLLRRQRNALTDIARSLPVCWSLSGALFLLSTLPIGSPYGVEIASPGRFLTQNVLFGLAAFWLVAPLVLVKHDRANRLLGTGPAKFLGDISYSVYLWHVPILFLVQRNLGFDVFTGHFWPVLALTSLGAVAVATVSWYLIERPCVRYLSGRARSRAQQQEAATAP